MKKICIILLLIQLPAFAAKKFFLSWSYNRSWHSKSNIKFRTKDGTFEVACARGEDRQTEFSFKNYFSFDRIFVPQYNIKLGYQLKPNLAIVLGTDHMKWILDNSRNYKIFGNYTGNTYDPKSNTPLTWNTIETTGNSSWLEYEHSDGYNYVFTGVEFSQDIKRFFNNKIAFQLREGIGPGILVTKTKTLVYRDAQKKEVVDNPFKITGFGAHLSLSPRVTFFDKLYIELELKATLVKVTNAPFLGHDVEKVSHSPISSLQAKYGLGYAFSF